MTIIIGKILYIEYMQKFDSILVHWIFVCWVLKIKIITIILSFNENFFSIDFSMVVIMYINKIMIPVINVIISKNETHGFMLCIIIIKDTMAQETSKISAIIIIDL